MKNSNQILRPSNAWTKIISGSCVMNFFRFGFILLFILSISTDAQSQYLKRSISTIPEVSIDISTPTAHYKPMFGVGDSDKSVVIHAVKRYGNLVVDPKGSSKVVSYADEELVLFVLEGTGILDYNKEKVPVSKNDFMYIPVGTKFGLSNPREKPLSVIVMGFKIQPGMSVQPTPQLMISNTDDVPLQVLGNRPTTRYQLMMGTTESTRDKLAAGYTVSSLFIMDFSVGGTNNPHRHKTEEEIYFVLRGHGEMIAGETADGKEMRHQAQAGDAFFYSLNTLVGFYSGNAEGEEHAQILAIRTVNLKE